MKKLIFFLFMTVLMKSQDTLNAQKEAILAEKNEAIETCLSSGTFSDDPILLEDVTMYLDEKEIRYEGYYGRKDPRLDVTLEDGTQLVFLGIKDSDDNSTCYELIMIDDLFNAKAFQEDYLNSYGEFQSEYYEPNLSEKVLTEEEIDRLSMTECVIARNQLFAKYGRKFEDAFLDQVFSLKSWYEPRYTPAEFDQIWQDSFTDIEKENLLAIMDYEKFYKTKSSGTAKAVRRLLSGSWIDLDGDGIKEQIIYQTRGIGEAYYWAGEVTLIVGDAQIEHDGYNTYMDCYIASMDGLHYYIVVGENGMSFDYVSTFYQYENGSLSNVGTMYTHPYILEMYPDKVLSPEKCDYFQSQNVKFRYELSNGLFVKREDDYYDYMQNIVTANQKISLYREKDSTEAFIVLHKGDEVQVMGGDMKNWVLLKKVSTGEEGWLQVDEHSRCILPDGTVVYSSDLFDGLIFYG